MPNRWWPDDAGVPGFLSTENVRDGWYYGIRSASGELIAMGGKRLKLEGFTEVSAVCTHPDFRGRGLAAAIIWQVVREHRKEGVWGVVAECCEHQSTGSGALSANGL